MSDFATTAASTWKSVSSTTVRLFHQYANWLVSITWWRFGALALLLLILTSIVQKLPPFRTSWSEVVEDAPDVSIPAVPKVTIPPVPKIPEIRIEAPSSKGDKNEDVVISIDKNGVRITPRAAAASASASAASAARAASAAEPASAASAAAAAPTAASTTGSSIEIALPGATREAIREAVRAAREAAHEATAEARQQAEEARREAQDAVEEAHRDAEDARREAQEANAQARKYKRTRVVRLGDSLMDLAFFWIVASAVLKFTYKGRVQAEERREGRGRLKIFLGYAPRVGKSLRMFDEGRRRKERGEDVVVGTRSSTERFGGRHKTGRESFTDDASH